MCQAEQLVGQLGQSEPAQIQETRSLHRLALDPLESNGAAGFFFEYLLSHTRNRSGKRSAERR